MSKSRWPPFTFTQRLARGHVTKKEIVRNISEELGLTQDVTKQIVQKTFDAIVDALVREGRIELRNFGVFEVKSRAARKARNPMTGQSVDVPGRFVVTFKPGKVMEAVIRDLPSNPLDDPPIGQRRREDTVTDSKPSDRGGPRSTETDPSTAGRWDDL